MKKIYTYLTLVMFASLCIVGCSEDTLDDSGIGKITGTVVMDGTNDPIENVKISTNPTTSTVFTDENGMFVLDEIQVGEYSVQAEKDELLTAFEGATVTNGNTTNVIFELSDQTSTNRPPDAPILDTPADNATEVALTAELIWIGSDPDNDELTYKVTIRNGVTDQELEFENVTDTTLTVSGLAFNTKYFWQVAANDGVNPDDVNSEVSSFTTVISPDNRFLFVREIGSNNVIYSVSDDGATALQITSTGENSWRPRKNTAVQRVAFLKSVGAEAHLFTMLEDGSDQRQVTSSVPVSGFNLDEVDFTWDPDGERLFFPSFDKLYAINIDGSGLELIFQATGGSLITEVDHALFTDVLAVKTNDIEGYNTSIFTIDLSGNVLTTVLSGTPGAAGGVNISADGTRILYSRDISGFENPDYRQLDSRLFIFQSGSSTDISSDKPGGTNDLDPRFSPNDASVIFVNTSNDGISQKDLVRIDLGTSGNNRTTFVSDGFMPDWE